MSVRALNASGDFSFGRGLNDYLTYNSAIGQDIQTRLYTFLGECFFDVTVGVDWWNLLGGKNQALIQLQCSTVILNTVGVTGINQLSVDLDPVTRNLTVSYEVTTVYTGTNYANATVSGTVFILTDQLGNELTDTAGFILEGTSNG